ncbi:MAG: TRAP transporter TatT component family protein [Rubrivivax sp.]
MQQLPRSQRRQAPAHRAGALCVLAAALGLSACAPRTLLLNSVGDQLAGQASAEEDDLVLAREASAFYLKLSESVLREAPDHAALATAVAAGFTQYAYAFVAMDADRLEGTDARGAQRLRERAARLYHRGHRHALAALNQRHPGLAAALAQPNPTLKLPAEDAALAYWAAAAWGGHIALSKDRPDVVADLPQAVRLAGLAYAAAPAWGQGDLAALMGTLEAARPGGQPSAARAYFEQAQTLGAGRNAGVFVAQAEALALPAGDRPAFEQLLRQALAAAEQRRDLANQVMRERAQWLLDTADDRF